MSSECTKTCLELYTNDEARLNFANWYRIGVDTGGKDPTPVLFSGEFCFHLAEYVNSLSNRLRILTKRALQRC